MDYKEVTLESFEVLGLSDRITGDFSRIPGLWNDFFQRVGEITGKEGMEFYGLAYDTRYEGKNVDFTSLVGVRVNPTAPVPDGMEKKQIPAGKYGLIVHRGSLDELKNTYQTFYSEHHDKVDMSGIEIEVYGERFDMNNPEKSEIDIFMPLR